MPYLGGFAGGGMGGPDENFGSGFSYGMSGDSLMENSIGPAGEIGGVMPGGSRSGGGMLEGGLSFGQGLGISALSGLFSALGGILAAQEMGRQAIKLKQTPANAPSTVQAAARGRRQLALAPPTQYAPQPAPTAQPSSPMLGSPNYGRQAMAKQLEQKMSGLLTQVGSPQLKASRFGVGGF